MAPEKCKYMDPAAQWNGERRCLLKAQGKVTMLQITSKHNEMGIVGSVYLNDICPFGVDAELKICPWFIEIP